MMKKLGSKLSSKSTVSQSTSSSLTDSLFSTTKSSHATHTVPEFQRQELPEYILLELRLACAAIVRETGPSGAELEAILNQADPLEQYKKDQQHKKDIEKIRLQAARTHTSAFPPVKGARERDRLSKSNLESMNISSTSLVSSQLPVKQSNYRPPVPQALKAKPIEPVELDSQGPIRNLSRKPVPGREVEKPPTKPRSQAEPKKAADDNHHGRTGHSSTSTTASNTTFDQHTSTSQTSITHTPADAKRTSAPYPLRSSSRQALRALRQDDNNSMLSDTDFFSPNPDYDVPSLYHVKGVSQVPSRTRSRAGSIKDSIIGGIRDYIQPRPSMERMSRSVSRQSRSTTRDSSATPSRSSSMTRHSREWMRNAASSLRRKGSLSSLRSLSRNGDDEDRGRSNKKDKGPDLNRKLPPLPGLDSYKEPKKHIAQLLSRTKFTSKPQQQQQQQQQHHHHHQQHPPPPPTTLRPLKTRSPPPPPAAEGATNPYFSVHPGISSPQTINQQSTRLSPDSTFSTHFPRIPFADPTAEEPLSPDDDRSASSSPEHHKRGKASIGSELLDRSQQEEELRRVVREKITQGGLSKEQFEAQRDSRHLLRSKTARQDDPWELERPETNGYATTGQVTATAASAHQRSKSVVEGRSANTSERTAKKSNGFRGRFSKLMGSSSGHHGHGQGSVITSH